MNNTKVLEEFFIWEENNSTEPKMKLENKIELEQKDSIINTKTVNECENWKTITDPKLRKKMRDKNWREVNKDYFKVWRKINKNKIRLKQKTYNEVNKDKIKYQIKAWREANSEKVKLQQKTYNEVNKDKINSYNKKKRKTNIQYRLSINLRSRLKSVLKNNSKSGSAVNDLGCSIEEFKLHIESKFQLGMSWDNYGYRGWHIDHIKPLSSFDLTDRNQMLEACHYTNLQPLWAKDNLSKSDKIV